MGDLLSLDRRVFLYLNNLGSKQYDFFWLWLSGTWVWVPLYIIFLYLLYKNFGLKNLIFLLLFIGIGITVSDQLAGIYKYGVMRARPCHDQLLIPLMRVVQCGGSYGFYSSHASNTFFVATFLSRILASRYQFFTIFIFLWALLVSYSRIYLGVHFPLDVLMGASVGFFLGGFFSSLAIRTISRKRFNI